MYEHDSVAEVIVVGIPDDTRPGAEGLREAQAGKAATAVGAAAIARGKLSKMELPAEIEFRDELPKTMVGKLSRKELRAERSVSRIRA